MGLIVFLHLLTGGIGTTCVALGLRIMRVWPVWCPTSRCTRCSSSSASLPASGVFRQMISLVRGRAYAYRNAIIVLVGGAVTSGIQTAVSQSVRGHQHRRLCSLPSQSSPWIVFLFFLLPALAQDAIRPTAEGQCCQNGRRSILRGPRLAHAECPLWVAQTHMAPWISGMRMPLIASGVTLTLLGVAPGLPPIPEACRL